MTIGAEVVNSLNAAPPFLSKMEIFMTERTFIKNSCGEYLTRFKVEVQWDTEGNHDLNSEVFDSYYATSHDTYESDDQEDAYDGNMCWEEKPKDIEKDEEHPANKIMEFLTNLDEGNEWKFVREELEDLDKKGME